MKVKKNKDMYIERRDERKTTIFFCTWANEICYEYSCNITNILWLSQSFSN